MFIRALLVSAFFVVSFLPALFSATRVAVIDLQPLAGVKKDMAVLITDSLRSFVYKADVFNLMNREDMVAILGEVKFQQSGACKSTSCIVDMGNALGLEKIIAGSVGKFGKKYSITVKLVDIATAKNDALITEYYEGREEDLPDFIKDLSLQIIDKEEELLAEKKGKKNIVKKKEQSKKKQRKIAKPTKKKPEGHSPIKAAMLGAIPGVGQIYNRQNLKGYIFAGAEVTALTLTLIYYKKTGDARDAYNNAAYSDDFTALVDDFEGKQKLNKIFAYVSMGIVGLSVADSYWFGRKINKLRLGVEQNKVRVCYVL